MGKRIVISNVYADDNRGGAAITSAAIDAVRRAFPSCEITLITIGPDPHRITESHRHTLRQHPDVQLVPAAFPVPAGRFGGVRAALRAIGYLLAPSRGAANAALTAVRNADLVMGKGGQAFRVRRGLAGACALWLAMFPLMYARRLRIPATVYSVTVGPYGRRSGTRALSGWILRRLSLVMVRDELSRDQALALGVTPERLVQVPDSVLGIDPPSAEAVREVLVRHGLQDVRFGAVTVNRPRPGEDPPLFEYLGAILLPLLDRRVVDRIVVVVQADGAVKSDYTPSKALVEHLADRRVTLLREDVSFQELSALYSGAAFTLGGRIHSTILSLVGATPAFPLQRGRARKADSIFRTLGLGDDVVRLDQPAEHHVSRIAEAVEQGERRRAAITATVTVARDACRRQTPALLRTLVDGAGCDASAQGDPLPTSGRAAC